LQGSGNASAPGTIYTAGAPIAGRLPNWTARLLQSGLHQDSATASRVGAPDLIVTGTVQSEAAGDIHVIAQNNITGAQAAFSDDLSDGNYSTAGQYW
ncbi:hypothetical protein, partial [Shewanella algae]|uniref:hypothetical protein n=1 Tax=Shewanella algae TaxID=38313 RepID=UPI00313C3D88